MFKSAAEMRVGSLFFFLNPSLAEEADCFFPCQPTPQYDQPCPSRCEAHYGDGDVPPMFFKQPMFPEPAPKGH